jgi:WhiB family redox-sensing transcriptional regulator
MPRSTAQLQPISEAWEWQLLGRCRDRSGAQFFHPDDDLGRISRRLREAAAKRLCTGCPVRPQCAAHALSVGEEYGVWGGYSENDRSLLREVGWQDAVDPNRHADVAKLDSRLARARAKASQAAAQRQLGQARPPGRSAHATDGTLSTGTPVSASATACAS